MPIKMSLNPDLARQFLNIMGATVDEFRLHISKEGWKVAAVDPANVALVIIDLPKDNFLSYEFESDNWTSNIDGHATGVLEENIAVGVDVDKIKEFFGGMHEAEIVLDEELHAPVECVFSIASGKYGRYQLVLKQGMFSRKILLLPETEIRKEPKIPKLGLDYKLHLNTLEFQRIVKKAAKVSDYLKLGFNREDPSIVIFTASTVDSDDYPWDATKQVHDWQALDKARNSSSSLFLLDYLCDIAEKIPSENVWLHIGHDYPCILSFIIGQTGTVEYKIAPRIESE